MDSPVIIGAGTTSEYGDIPDRSRLSLAAEAIKDTVRDAGIDRHDIDGYISNMGAPIGVNYERLCEALNLDVDYSAFYWAHGRWTATMITQAAMAITQGLAEYVLVGLTIKFNMSDQVRGTGMEQIAISDLGSLSEHGERPWYGFGSPSGDTALTTRYYMERYGGTSEDLAHVSKALRRHASMTPGSHFSTPISIDDHQSSRWIVEPLRLLDCAPLSDGAAYLILTTESNAESLTDQPVYVAGSEGLKASRDEYSFSYPGMGIRTQREYDYQPGERVNRIYDRAGITRDDIDAVYLYDAFTPLVWFVLERWGFCPPGTAYEFTRNGAIELDGELPVNTHGGLISNGHIGGFNHFAEMYRQLTGQCGDRQLAGPTAMQWMGNRGDSVILRGDRDAS